MVKTEGGHGAAGAAHARVGSAGLAWEPPERPRCERMTPPISRGFRRAGPGARQSPRDWERFCHLHVPRVEHAGLWPAGCECPPCRGQARGSLGTTHLGVLLVRALEGCFLSLANVCVVKVEGIPYLCKTDEVGEICVNSSATATAYYGLLGITKNIFEVRAWFLPLC